MKIKTTIKLMLFENRNNQKFLAKRLNAWINQFANLFTSMSSTCFLAAVITPLLDGHWPSNLGLWLIAGIMLLLGSLMILNFLSVEEET